METRTDPDTDARFVECPRCSGEGGWESAPWGVNYRDGSVLSDWVRCDTCNGTGSIEEVVPLIDEDDLDDAFGLGLRDMEADAWTLDQKDTF